MKAALSLALGTLLGSIAPAFGADVRPNIVYLHSHDTGRYVQPYGYAVATPNLQRFAEQGMLFRNAHTAAPTCSPSRACLLSGQSAHSNGMLGLAHRGFVMSDYSHHLNHTLKKAGYGTALSGIQHIAGSQFVDLSLLGYDRMLNHSPTGEPDVQTTDQAAVEFLNSRPTQPFFLDVGFFETHRRANLAGTFVGDDGLKGDARYVRPPAPLPDHPLVRQDMADYVKSAAILDAKMGRVLDALQANGLAENTLVILTTDHGIPFPAMKSNLTDHGTGVMLIVRGPGGFSGGKVSDALVTQIDLFPTICHMLQIDAPDWLEGRSLLPLVSGEAKEVNEAIFAEVNYHSSYEPKRAVRTQRWKYIRRFDGRSHAVLPHTDNGTSKSYWHQQGWSEQPRDAESLYDLMFDPNESHNLATDPRHADTLAEMRKRLQAWMERTHDPLLTGSVAAPKQVKVTDVDAFSPNGKDSPETLMEAVQKALPQPSESSAK